MPDKKELTQTGILKHYLLTKENPYLLDDNNNGKTIMLSGAWGSGKTHFWQEEIAREQKKIKISNKEVNKYTPEQYEEGLHSKLKKKACVYVSLYGKTSIEALELDVYMKAYQNIVGDSDTVSTMCSVFTNLGKNLGNMAHKGVGGTFAWMENLVDKDKFNKASTYLNDGGIICFDDFERKSKEIDLNDLFGFISQLALEYRCKIIIILNSDVFTGKEAEIFSRVKEKTISKFFYFNPPIEELFKSISSDSKYDNLGDSDKEYILSVIKETEELNARVYTQVLDNCLEWKENKQTISKEIIRVLVLGTVNFILYHLILKYANIQNNPNKSVSLYYDNLQKYSANIQQLFKTSFLFAPKNKITGQKAGINVDDPTTSFMERIEEYLGKQGTDKSKKDFDWFLKNKQIIEAIWKYGYKLYYVGTIDKNTYEEISNFIKTGILLP